MACWASPIQCVRSRSRLVARATELDHRSPRPSPIAGTARSRTQGAPVGGATEHTIFLGPRLTHPRFSPARDRRPPVTLPLTHIGIGSGRSTPRVTRQRRLPAGAAHRRKASRHPARCLPRADQGRPEHSGRGRPDRTRAAPWRLCAPPDSARSLRTYTARGPLGALLFRRVATNGSSRLAPAKDALDDIVRHARMRDIPGTGDADIRWQDAVAS